MKRTSEAAIESVGPAASVVEIYGTDSLDVPH